MNPPVFSMTSISGQPSSLPPHKVGEFSLTCYPDTFFSAEGLAPTEEMEQPHHLPSSLPLERGGSGNGRNEMREFAISIHSHENAWVKEANKIADEYEYSLPHISPEDGGFPVESVCTLPR